MLRVNVNMDDGGVKTSIADFIRTMQDRTALHTAMGAEVNLTVMEHLRGLNARSPNTDFYNRASQATEVDSDGNAATITIGMVGMALRFYGGRVTPGKSISSFTGKPTTSISIPSDNVPLGTGAEGRIPPRDAGILAFLPSKKTGTKGVLVEGEEKTITRGPRKGGKRIVPKAAGNLMYVLRSWTDHKEDPSVLPTEAELRAAAVSGIQQYIQTENPDLLS